MKASDKPGENRSTGGPHPSLRGEALPTPEPTSTAKSVSWLRLQTAFPPSRFSRPVAWGICSRQGPRKNKLDNMTPSFWRLARRERGAYPGSVTSEQRRQPPEEPVRLSKLFLRGPLQWRYRPGFSPGSLMMTAFKANPRSPLAKTCAPFMTQIKLWQEKSAWRGGAPGLTSERGGDGFVRRSKRHKPAGKVLVRPRINRRIRARPSGVVFIFLFFSRIILDYP